MTFFGLYSFNRTTGAIKYDIYDPNYVEGSGVADYFVRGSYVEGRHKPNHNITVDGFWTNIGDYTDPNKVTITKEYIEILSDGDPFYDWIVGEDRASVETTLVGSIYSKEVTSSLALDYSYTKGITYNLSRVSINALKSGVNLVDPATIPNINTNIEEANTNFGLTMQTSNSGWIKSSKTNIYTKDNGSTEGDTTYISDNSDDIPELRFKLYNSTNITKRQDLGKVSIILTGKKKTGEDSSEGSIFVLVVVVNLMTAVDEDLYQYMPSFTDRPETELTYTNDSKVNLSYLMYKNESESETSGNIYSTGDYRTLSSTMRLPEGTKLTLIDYAQEENQIKSYYYKVASSTDYDSTETTKDGIQRYIYKLSKFKDMDATSTNSQYSNDNSKYYNDQNKYAFERYDLSVDFENTNISSDMIGQQIYLQLRTSNGIIKVDNQVSEVKFNLLTNKNAIMIADISNKGTTLQMMKLQ